MKLQAVNLEQMIELNGMKGRNHKISVMKAVTWRVLATLITLMVAYAITREAVLSISVGIGDSVLKLIAYYSHERLWNRIERAGSRVDNSC